MAEKSFVGKLKRGLFMTHTEMIERVRDAFTPELGVDQSVLDALEESLLGADVGAEITVELMDSLEETIRRGEIRNIEDLTVRLKAEARELIPDRAMRTLDPSAEKPFVVLVVGVNGTGKTTSIAKLARLWKSENREVIVGAADTFRAAAIEQLQEWTDRVGVPLVRHKEGADPGAVAHDTVAAARSRGSDIVLIDTAGRLHNKGHLMAELAKIRRVVEKELPGAPHEVLLVLDGTTGQNGIAQAKAFLESAGVTGLIVTKLDGTAKGGVILSIMRDFEIPVYYVGVGEGMDDLIPFDPEAYLDSIFASEHPVAAS
ncbi:MAG: signal recognition particle-docking protein FtsY [Acidobacteria bacterium]|nr:signal recognition particle-docking protein FtsY [Acidobacteriota bacterium]